jgi:hypothetical protein
MEIKLNLKPKLKKIKMICDIPINKKLNKYPLFKDNLNCQNTTLFVGLQGSGKTSLLINFMSHRELYYGCFENIYVFMRETSRNSLKNNIFDDSDILCFEELNLPNLEKVYEHVKENSENNERSIIIMDDVQNALKDYDVVKLLKNMIANQRHLNLVNFIILQNYLALDKSIREIVNNVIFFKLSKTQMEEIFTEVFEKKKDKFNEIIDFCFKDVHNWIFINKRNQKIYKEFDEIIIN